MPSSDSTHHNRSTARYVLWGTLLLGVAVAALALWMWRRGKSAVRRPREPRLSQRHKGISAPPARSPRQPGTIPAGALTERDFQGDAQLPHTLSSVESVRHVMALYKKAKRYPSSTLRLTKKMVDVLRPNIFHPTTSLFTTKADRHYGRFSPSGEDRIMVRIETDHFSYSEESEIPVRLAIYRGDEAKSPVAASLGDAQVLLYSDGEFVRKSSFSLATVTPVAPGAPQYVGSLRLDAITPQEYSGYVKILVPFTIPDEEPSLRELVVHYSRSLAGRFTGEMTDALDDGSLAIEVAVNVSSAGRFNLTGLVYNSDGTVPVTYCNKTVTLKEGLNRVKMIYYGLVFHDAGIPGPYVLTTLRGYKLAEGGSGKGIPLEEWSGRYTTRAYQLDEFTRDEHTSPEKEGALKAFEAQLKALE